ncbi:1-phosphatidylinositol 4,5-bisphosphate phosphodiesterase eta-2-like [Uloborus diversus]|uniref:1-phosphatidylinositol 4,5-bisphosphate phosphodiesterase eta-2-like n=1 Tax=Uloborus diversus TaxID=327109 RepID=UPI0024098B89|nr:1-phosphatidylinositol 4,5-bisphosphate phosphodiesterase eta-2-like [Uloborus diversus]
MCTCFRTENFEVEDGEDPADDEDLRKLPLTVILRGMSMGTVMYKVRTPDRWYRRKYRVDLQNLRLSYSPSSKSAFWRGSTACVGCASVESNVVDLFNLEEVRKGWNSDVFNKLEAKMRKKLQSTLHPHLRSRLKEENCFSLIFGPGGGVVDLIAPNEPARDAWVRGISYLIAGCKHVQAQHDHDRWLREQVRKADVNGNGSLNFEECLGLLNRLNIHMRRKEARKLFDASNFRKVKVDGEEALEPDEFVNFYRSLRHRPELLQLMNKYSVSKSELWSAEELRNFLSQEQKMLLNMDECDALIEEYEPKEGKVDGYLSLEGFHQLLLSADHDIFYKRHRIIYQDMTLPLQNYYIASSHNTYLLSGQLIGESSIEGYIQALMRGCRCLELDTWDGPDGEPIVFHGYTLTSRILLRDILQAIQQYGFRASQYPIILSLENHCSLPYQVRMAELFVEILGEYLYKDPVGEEETQYPSPEALARKILIKGKKLRIDPQGMMSPELLEEEEDREEEVLATTRKLAENPEIPTQEGCDEVLAAAPMAAPSHAVALELSDLVNYFSARRFESFEESKETWSFFEMASFQETRALSLGDTHGSAFVEHNKMFVSRIYPKGTRTDSGNYDPIPHWNLGCQLVALNYQTRDYAMYMNEAKFAQNGKCGYVLKPDYLIDRKISYSPSEAPRPGHEMQIAIQVISGQLLPKPNRAEEGGVVDPYVSIKVVGHPLDKQKAKTKWINNNGFNPVWNQTLNFVLRAPELAIFHFRVKTVNVTSNELIGQFALPSSSLAEGYRHVHLEDAAGHSLQPATIFIHVKITEHAQYRRGSVIKH